MNKYAPVPNDNGTTGDSGLSAADLSTLGIGGDVEPSSKPMPANPDAVGVTVPDDAATQVPKPAAVTPTQPVAPIAPTEQSAIDKVLARKGKPAARDYSGLDDRGKALFSAMSNEAYAELYPLYKRYISDKDSFDKLPELKQQLETLKQQVNAPRDYYDHEHAYLLSPSYQEGLMERNQHAEIRNFWQEQLEKIEAGQPFQVLVRTPNEDGSYSLSRSQQIDPKAPKARATILSELTKAESNYGAAEAKLQATAQTIKGKYSNFNKLGDRMIQEYFGKHTEMLKPNYEKHLSKFAPELRNHPAMRFAAYALAALEQATADGDHAAVRAAATAANSAAASVAGPTAAQVHAAPGKQAPKLTDAEFKQFKGEFGL